MRRIAAVAAVTAMLGAVGFVASPAAAQTGYPPGPCDVLFSSQHLGAFPVGTTFSLSLTPVCVFTPGTPVTVTVNGVVTGVKPASAAGSVPISITILSNELLSVDDPVLVPAFCGNVTNGDNGDDNGKFFHGDNRNDNGKGHKFNGNGNDNGNGFEFEFDDGVRVGVNTIVATGLSAAAGNRVVTHTVTFEIICQPEFDDDFEGKKKKDVDAVKQPKVAFTGANVLRWSAIALGCIGVGALFVSSSRKRRQRTPELVD